MFSNIVRRKILDLIMNFILKKIIRTLLKKLKQKCFLFKKLLADIFQWINMQIPMQKFALNNFAEHFKLLGWLFSFEKPAF